MQPLPTHQHEEPKLIADGLTPRTALTAVSSSLVQPNQTPLPKKDKPTRASSSARHILTRCQRLRNSGPAFVHCTPRPSLIVDPKLRVASPR